MPPLPGTATSGKDSDEGRDFWGPLGPCQYHTTLATGHLEAGLPWSLGLAHEPRIALTQGSGPKLGFRWPHSGLPRATVTCAQARGEGSDLVALQFGADKV